MQCWHSYGMVPGAERTALRSSADCCWPPAILTFPAQTRSTGWLEHYTAKRESRACCESHACREANARQPLNAKLFGVSGRTTAPESGQPIQPAQLFNLAPLSTALPVVREV